DGGVDGLRVGFVGAGPAADGLPPAGPVGRPPRPVSSEGAGRAAAGAVVARVDTRPAGAYNRRVLFGDGGDVRPEGVELPGVAGGGPADVGGAVAAGR